MAAMGRQALTVLLPVRAGREQALEALLEQVGPALSERLHGAETLHFARLVLVPPSDAEGPRATELLIETTYDGELGRHLEELHRLAGAELARVLGECEPVSAGAGLFGFEATLRSGVRSPRAFAAAHAELGVTRIRHDAALRESVLEVLERERASLGSAAPLEILRSLRRSLGLGAEHEARSEGAARAAPSESDVVLQVRALPLVLGMLVQDLREWAVGLWHDRAEPRAPVSAGGRAPVQVARAAQSAFAHLGVPRSGGFRRRALRRALLFLASALARLGAEPAAPGVHELRFVLLDDGRLLFTDQHDGSLTERLAALGRRARALLALVWSSTQGFPGVLLRHLLGRSDDEGLRDWLRARELRSGFWYSAYPMLTVRDVAVNAELRSLLTAEPTETSARRVLELL